MAQPQTASRGGLLIRGGTIVTHETMFDADNGSWTSGSRLWVRIYLRPLVSRSSMHPGFWSSRASWTRIRISNSTPASTRRPTPGWRSRAASFGGITTVVDFATQFKGQSFEQALAGPACGGVESVIDYAFHMMVTDVPEGSEEELGVLPELGIRRHRSSTTYRPNYYADDATLVRLLEAAGRYGRQPGALRTMLLLRHELAALVQAGHTGWAYHGASRPPLAEQEEPHRGCCCSRLQWEHRSSLRMSRRAGPRSSWTRPVPPSEPLSSRRRRSTCCWTTHSTKSRPWRYILQPPLRAGSRSEALWGLVSDGRVDMIVTDHCDTTRTRNSPWTISPRPLADCRVRRPRCRSWRRTASLQASSPGLISPASCRRARPESTNSPRKGALQPGSDADLVRSSIRPAEGVIAADDLHMVRRLYPL